jgi:heme oxygenase
LVTAQEKTAEDTNMEILREKVRADKKLLIAANMDLTDTEATAFWPVYEEYQKQLDQLNDRLKKAIESYAEAFNANTLTDETAKKLIDESLAIDAAEVQMRKDFSGKLAEVLPGKKVARYLQLENKVRAMLRYELAEGIPLVE